MENKLNYSILIVDDEKQNLNVLNHTLHREYTVYMARDGKTAIEIANEYVPDLILLDIIMPDMDGYEVISALKASEKTKNIPVIFITGLDSKDEKEMGIALGAVAYISKPFSAAVLKATVNEQIKKIEN